MRACKFCRDAVFRSVSVLAAAVIYFFTAAVAAGPAVAADVNYEFGAQPAGARAWLAAQGFEFKLDADNAARVHISLSNRGLKIDTLGRAEPIIAHPGLSVAQPARLSVTWGVDSYPAGANWDVGAHSEAIMAMVFFGTEKLPGGFFVPPSPYFIGFFLCQNGRRGVPIAGRSYTRQGRYVCLGGPPPGKELTSAVTLADSFRAAFHASTVPPVTGLAFEADTTQVGPEAHSSAWIRSIKIAPSD
jgi:hypothetical protein